MGDKLDHNLKKINPAFEQGTLSITLDDLVSSFKLPIPNYLKIDVDGIEYKIIKSSNLILKNKDLESILIEINPSGKKNEQIIKKLQDNGFNYEKNRLNLPQENKVSTKVALNIYFLDKSSNI